MKMQKIAGLGVSIVALFALASAAQALSLTPASPGVIPGDLGPSNCEPGCVYTAFGLANDGSLTLYHEHDTDGQKAGSHPAPQLAA